MVGTGRWHRWAGGEPGFAPGRQKPHWVGACVLPVVMGDPARERRGRKDGQSCRRKSARWPPLNLSFLFLSSSIVSCPCSVVPVICPLSALSPDVSSLVRAILGLTSSLSFPCFFFQIFSSLSAPWLLFPSFTLGLFSHPCAEAAGSGGPCLLRRGRAGLQSSPQVGGCLSACGHSAARTGHKGASWRTVLGCFPLGRALFNISYAVLPPRERRWVQPPDLPLLQHFLSPLAEFLSPPTPARAPVLMLGTV